MTNQIPSLHPASWTPALFGRMVAREGSAGPLMGVLLAWQERAGQRRRLAEMEDRLLADMGFGRAEAFAEAAKPFWRH
jgi:uncharacterized protein YjiS (DUF1127 family)